jgi:1,4-alpha-glucan branching enzyme
LQAPEARSVHLIGTFCGWDRQAHPLSPGEKKGTWEVIVPLGPGTYEYAFLVDGQEVVTPPQAPLYVDDGFGQRNGVLVVEDK